MASKKKKDEDSGWTLDGMRKVLDAHDGSYAASIKRETDAAKQRAEAIAHVPFDAIFTTEAAGTENVPDVLKESIEAGLKGGGFSFQPDAMTVALVRAAAYWYKKANGE